MDLQPTRKALNEGCSFCTFLLMLEFMCKRRENSHTAPFAYCILYSTRWNSGLIKTYITQSHFSLKSRVVNIAAFKRLLPWLATPIQRGVVIIVHVEKPLETWAVPGGMCTDGWSRHKQSGICLVWCAFISLVKSHPSAAPLKPEHILSLFNYKHGRLIWKHPNSRASS